MGSRLFCRLPIQGLGFRLSFGVEGLGLLGQGGAVLWPPRCRRTSSRVSCLNVSSSLFVSLSLSFSLPPSLPMSLSLARSLPPSLPSSLPLCLPPALPVAPSPLPVSPSLSLSRAHVLSGCRPLFLFLSLSCVWRYTCREALCLCAAVYSMGKGGQG